MKNLLYEIFFIIKNVKTQWIHELDIMYIYLKKHATYQTN